MNAGNLGVSGDDTLIEETAFGDPRIVPDNAIVKGCVGTDLRTRADGRRAGEFSIGGDSRGGINPERTGGAALRSEKSVHREILFPRPEIPPMTVIDDNPAKPGTGSDHLQKNRDDADFCLRGNSSEKCGIDQVNAGEEEGGMARGIESFSNIDDAPRGGIACDLQRPVFRPENHRHFISRGAMRINGRLQGEVRENIAVVNDEGLVTQEIVDIFNAAAGFENMG